MAMNYVFNPSLEHIALTKITATLWNQPDARDLLTQILYPYGSTLKLGAWQAIEDKVIEKVTNLQIPECLKHKVIGCIKPIGLQILKWMDQHHKDFDLSEQLPCYLGVSLPREFSWTSQGTLDLKKTAEIIIADENIDLDMRYKFACVYCLEEEIPKLWRKLPKDCKRNFYGDGDPIHIRQHDLVVLWTYDMKGKLSMMDNMIERKHRRRCSAYQYAFESAAKYGNKPAVEYFWGKLTTTEKNESLVKTALTVANTRCMYFRCLSNYPKGYYAGVLCFLFSQMTKDQQLDIYEKGGFHVLKCLLDWPYQVFFIDTAHHMWNFFPKNCYDLTLLMIINKVMDGFKDCNYQKLFAEFWLKSPRANKKHAVKNGCLSGLLYKLLLIKDRENIELILQEANKAERKELILNDLGNYICKDLIESKEWDLLEFFIRQCILSKDDLINFKEALKEHLSFKEGTFDEIWNKLSHLVSEYDKRKFLEDEDNSPAKRICSVDLSEDTEQSGSRITESGIRFKGTRSWKEDFGVLLCKIFIN